LFLGLSGLFQQQNGFYINDLSDKTSFLHDSLKGTPEDGQRMGDERAIYGNLHLKWIPSSKLLLSYNSKIESDKSIGASSYYQAVENDSIALAKPYTFAVNSLGSDARWVWNNSLALKYFHPKFNFISTSAYQHLRQAYHHIDQDLWPYDYATGSTYGRDSLGGAFPQQVWSQEIRFSNNKEKSFFDWTAGTYAFYQRNNKQYASVYERLALLFGQEPGVEVNKNDMRNLGISAFGQIAKNFWQNRIKVVVGLRYDFEQRSAVIAKFRVDSLGNRDYIVADTSKSKGFQALSPLLSGSYYLNAHQNIYLSYKRGFRAGGTNFYNKLSEYEFYLPEYSDNFELGYKLQSVNRKYALNLVLFFMHWQNLQLDMQPEPGAWVVSNIGKVNSMGAELECSAKPFKGFSADFSLGITDARYLGFDYLGQDIKGNRAILAPTHTAFLSIQQDLPIAKKFLMSLRLETRHTGKQYFDLVNSIEQPAYWLFNGQASFGNKHFRLSFWMQNIGQRTYITYAMPGYFKSTLLNRPRSFGLSLSSTF
jgi:iron complex outermembrane receptor protein